jgi:hypothetical protein
MTTTETLLQQGIRAARAGKREEARDLLMQVVRSDERNEEAWLWLSGVVDDPDDMRTCLQNVLDLNPGNEKAQQGLAWVDSRYAASQSTPESATATKLNQEDIEQQQQLLATHRRTLAHLLTQRAKFSSGYVPAHVANGINDARSQIHSVKRDLLKFGIVDNRPGDFEPTLFDGLLNLLFPKRGHRSPKYAKDIRTPAQDMENAERYKQINPMRKLTKDQRRKLLNIILDSFSGISDLEIMVRLELDEQLNHIVGGDNLREIAFNLIKWSEAEGHIDDLIKGIVNEKPKRVDAHAFAREILGPDV